MAECKDQHYVPKFYFKLFSKSGIVEVYDVRDKQFHPGSCKDLCAEDWFYSKDAQIEKCLSRMEQDFSIILNKIINNTNINQLTDKEYYLLLLFLVVQNDRTAKGKELSEDYVNFFIQDSFKDLLKKNTGKLPWITENSFETDQMPAISGPIHAIALKNSLETGPLLLSDLTPIILINRTEMEFIFSDSPVVLYNSFFNDKDGYRSSGIQAHGLQIFCPLNSKTMLILFDSNYYSFKKNQCNNIDVTSESDVDALNALQFLNCIKWIFFTDKTRTKSIGAQHSRLDKSINDDHFGIEKYSIQAPSGLGREFALTYKKDIDYTLAGSLSFMFFKNPKKIVSPFNFRNDELVYLAKQKSQNFGI
jgi:hypothetical protein